MSINGYLSEFSLAELFKFLGEGSKSGLLNLISISDSDAKKPYDYYIWFREGRIITAANSLDSQCLMRLIEQRGWYSYEVIAKKAENCPRETPLGLYLKSQGFLDAEQLKMLFYVQVMRSVCALFTLKDACFDFNEQASFPLLEMTGLSSPPWEVTLAGLRALRDWTALSDKLPESSSALINITENKLLEGKPKLAINQAESQVWEFTNSNLPLKEIAKRLNLPLEKVQQISFRLIAVGLVEELPMAGFNNINNPNETQSTSKDSLSKQEKTVVSQSFLDNLMGFLRNQV